MHIADIKKLDPGTTIKIISGRIAEVYKRRDVNGQRGPTSVQGIKLQEDREFIMVDCWGRDDLSPLKGQDVKITSDRGMPLKENNWTDKQGKQRNDIKLTVSESAVISSQAWGNEENEPVPTYAQQVSPQSTPPPAASSTHRPTPDEPTVKMRLNRLANLYLDCIVAADYVTATRETMGKWSMTDGHYQACVASLFIQATRDGLQDKVAGGKFNVAEPVKPAPVAPPPPPPPPPPPQPAVRQDDPGYAFPPNEGVDDPDCPF